MIPSLSSHIALGSQLRTVVDMFHAILGLHRRRVGLAVAI